MDQLEVNVITLDNDKDYTVIDKIIYNGNTYYYLVGEDEEDVCIRKLIIKDNEEYLSTINNDEYNKVMELFLKKYKGDK